MMTNQEFAEHFVATFLATYAANHYEEWCMRGQHERFDSLPVEDALNLAEKAYDQVTEKLKDQL